MVKTLLGIGLITYGISCFIQSFRQQDSSVALKQDGVQEKSQENTSITLIVLSIVSILAGIFILL
jgi:uncharacterized membrane protein HdeD (DUF308 family)